MMPDLFAQFPTLTQIEPRGGLWTGRGAEVRERASGFVRVRVPPTVLPFGVSQIEEQTVRHVQRVGEEEQFAAEKPAARTAVCGFRDAPEEHRCRQRGREQGRARAWIAAQREQVLHAGL